MATGNGRGPVTWEEMTAGLIWPRILRAAPMALQPSRLAASFGLVVCLMAAGLLFDWIANGIAGPVTPAAAGEEAIGLFGALVQTLVMSAHGALGGAVVPGAGGIGGVLIAGVATMDLAAAHPWRMALLLLTLIPIWSLFGTAICRMAVCDLAAEMQPTAAQGLAFSLRRWRDSALALVAPAAMVGILALLMAAAGAVLLRFPVINVIGAVVYGLFIAGAVGIVLLWAGFALGKHLLLPAIAAESCDFLDAVQRAYSYVLGRTLRLVVYAAGLLVYGLAAYAVAAAITFLALDVAARIAFAWAGVDEATRLQMAGGYGLFPLMAPERGEGITGTALVAARIIGVWERIAIGMLGAFALSFYFAASSILYLLVRRVNDDEDIHEIWMPGMIDGTRAPVAPENSGDAGGAHGA